ncbi:HAD family hydrolase [filamentous cyanobacterium CCP1]|nr:HAD family hydrolase [filamentous cyanobacterium CCP2]PSB66659.1 HAD family hydrolase [filamentous cyanobacterium CCP1]
MATIHCGNKTFNDIWAVIFDKDGTLASSESFLRNLAYRRSRLIDAQIPGVQDPLLMAFGADNDQFNPSGLMAVGTRLDNEIAAAAYVAETGRDWIESLEIVRSAFAEADKYLPRKATETPPLEGAVELLQVLTQTGLKVGILSSDSTQNVQEFVQCYDLVSSVHCQLGSDGYSSKSDPALLEQLFVSLGAIPENTLMVGDSQLDVQIAQTSGMAGCIAVTGGWTKTVRVSGADAIVHHLNEIQVVE